METAFDVRFLQPAPAVFVPEAPFAGAGDARSARAAHPPIPAPALATVHRARAQPIVFLRRRQTNFVGFARKNVVFGKSCVSPTAQQRRGLPLAARKIILVDGFPSCVGRNRGGRGGRKRRPKAGAGPPCRPDFGPTHDGKPSTRTTFSRPQGAGGGCAATIGFLADLFVRPIERLKVE